MPLHGRMIASRTLILAFHVFIVCSCILDLNRRDLSALDAGDVVEHVDETADETTDEVRDPVAEGDCRDGIEIGEYFEGDVAPDDGPAEDIVPEGRCTSDRDCDDLNPCTEDVCLDGSCDYGPVVDMTPCAGGVCCAGECRAGGDCCSNADCTGGCKGTARNCNEYATRGMCSSQTGCIWDVEGPCSGSSPYECTVHDGNEVRCGHCGCTWAGPYCMGAPEPCDAFAILSDCSDCGCTWDPEGPCEGVHEACTTYGSQSMCEIQKDCYWSVCSEYNCT